MAKASLSLLLLLCTSVCSFPVVPAPAFTVISGRIVAYSDVEPLACLNGNAYWSMIIHVQNAKDAQAEFVRVRFSLPCGETPKWLSARQSERRFRLIRDKDSDEVLDEFVNFVEQSTGAKAKPAQSLPIWKYPPGAEKEKLPFGRVVPAYQSVDLPLAPVV